MREIHDLAAAPWMLSGWTPETWRMPGAMEVGSPFAPEIEPVPAKVPGSVQAALRQTALLPDWCRGLDARACEWVEHRIWVFETRLPAAAASAPGRTTLHCLGLDGFGWVFVNGQQAGRFDNAFVPHAFDLTPHLRASGNRLQIVFNLPPRWLGQFGRTSQMTRWKPRFNYTWDWTPRLVQIGIWDAVYIEVQNGPAISMLDCGTDYSAAGGQGRLDVKADLEHVNGARARLRLEDASGGVVREETLPAQALRDGIAWHGLAVEPWWPNGAGAQNLYRLDCTLLDRGGAEHDCATRKVGFRHIEWRPCANAPAHADPWICVVNGRPIFLQGVNWTPIRPNFADVSDADCRARLETYRDLGCNCLRVWGGAVLEKEVFYDHCDALGLLVWQEFPLSSSGLENWPPEDDASIAALEATAVSYIQRRRHHPALLLWSGGNELQGGLDGSREGGGKPVDLTHPLIRRFADAVERHDPGRRFVPTSSSGPRFHADAADYGKGLHWDVHGPWRCDDSLDAWRDYWDRDDSLFRSEVGAPGASPVDIIREYAGGLPETPGTIDNPLWRRFAWWIEWHRFEAESGRAPQSLDEYVAWSQVRQAGLLRHAAAASKRRFPGIGGILFWMGHDCFPCTANTALLDFHGRPKPAALAVADIFRSAPNQT